MPAVHGLCNLPFYIQLMMMGRVETPPTPHRKKNKLNIPKSPSVLASPLRRVNKPLETLLLSFFPGFLLNGGEYLAAAGEESESRWSSLWRLQRDNSHRALIDEEEGEREGEGEEGEEDEAACFLLR